VKFPVKLQAIAMAACIVAIAGTAGAEINWSDASYEQMLQRAQQENKNVFIDFYATWCGPCKRLDKDVYPDARVETLLNSMVSAKFDAEKDPWKPTADKFRVRAYPTLIVISPEGKEIGRYIGYMDPPDFVEVIGAYAAGQSQMDVLAAQLAKNPDDFDLQVNAGTVYSDAGRADDALPHFEKALTLDPNDERDRHAEIYHGMAEALYGAKRYEEAKTYYGKVMKNYPESDYYNDSARRLAATEYKLGNSDEAVALYWSVTKDRQDDPGALNGFAWFCAQRQIGLEQALPAAQKAVELSKRDPGILDTLAEVYYARGEYDDAIKIGKEALKSDPDDQYFKDQVVKFEKAKKEAAARS
jgi:tetratricopeptide (TPR) repeat protein